MNFDNLMREFDVWMSNSVHPFTEEEKHISREAYIIATTNAAMKCRAIAQRNYLHPDAGQTIDMLIAEEFGV